MYATTVKDTIPTILDGYSATVFAYERAPSCTEVAYTKSDRNINWMMNVIDTAQLELARRTP